MHRIILHWTAGAHTPNGLDLNSYHYVIDGAGKVHAGKHPVAANRGPGPLKSGTYAAHTLNCNTNSIGVALAAMAGAQERPFSAGKHPITAAQLEALTRLVVDLCDQHSIPVTRETVLSHAEVQGSLGIKQKNKWDIMWLPGMSKPGDPVGVGDELRERIRAVRRVTPDPKPGASPKAIPSAASTPPTKAPAALAPTGFWAWLKSIFRN